MNKIVPLFFFLILFQTDLLSNVIKPNSFQANSNGSNITLRWETLDESNVLRFEIERRSGVDGQFIYIATVDPKGPSQYELIDYSVLNKSSSIFQYRLKIIFSNNISQSYIGPVSVVHTVSGIRRTWGSIKAIFR